MYDYNQNSESYSSPKQRSGMETASIVLGILAFIGSACCYIALPLSAIGILLALLSKGHNQRMSPRAKSGLFCSIISLALTVGMTGYALYQYRDVFTSPDFQDRMKNYMEYYYSDDKEEEDFLDDFFNDRDGGAGSYDGYWETTPYGGEQNTGSLSPGPEL